MDVYLALRVIDIVISGLALLLSLTAIGIVLGMKWSKQSILYQPVSDPLKEYGDDTPKARRAEKPEPEQKPYISDEAEKVLQALGLGQVDEDLMDPLN